ncbi:hypothetical protein, partial [Novacetimonas hansenii]|uniref:hypothetical protein n=2 Tax=Acetobacteraceae TaxID=433 RepID=UPI000D968B59
RRPDAIAKTVNQIAKSQKLPAKHINQRFFDPSIFIAIKWFLRRQKRQSAADYHYLLVFDKCRNTLIMLVNILIFQHVSDTLNYGKVPY